MQFRGKITEIKPIRSGETAKGEWANAEFEVTESNPANADYPQVGLFDFFKNGEYVKFAKDFNTYFKLGDEVEVSYNLKKNTYQKKDGSGEANFYKTSAWKIEKAEEMTPSVNQPPTQGELEADDLPF